MLSDEDIRPAIQEIEVTSEVAEEEKPTSHKENETGPQATAMLEKNEAPQEKTNAAQDKASKKYMILMHKDLLQIPVSLYFDKIFSGNKPCQLWIKAQCFGDHLRLHFQGNDLRMVSETLAFHPQLIRYVA
jgi:hypothetical protein